MSNYKSIFLFRCLLLVFLLAFGINFFSCSPNKYTATINYKFSNNINEPDYNNLDYWAAHPRKKDPSDNVPEDLKKRLKDSIANVFFIHPTTYTGNILPMGWNADINNVDVNWKTDNSTILYQPSVFNKYCRVFAPRYRQLTCRLFSQKILIQQKNLLILLIQM